MNEQNLFSGYVKVWQSIKKNKFWYRNENRPATKFEAMIYLLLKAHHKPEPVIYDGIEVTRGQFTMQQRKLAHRLNWNVEKVNTFLKQLQAEDFLKVETKQVSKQLPKQVSKRTITFISIVNYDFYNPSSKQKAKQVSKQKAKQPPYSIYEINEIKEKDIIINNNIQKEKIDSVYQTYEEKFKTKVRARTETRASHILARLQTFSLEEIQEAIENYSRTPFYQGENDRGWKADIDFIIRSDEQIEKGLKLVETQTLSDAELLQRALNA